MARIFPRLESDAVLSQQPPEHWKRPVAVTRALRLGSSVPGSMCHREQRDVILDERRLVLARQTSHEKGEYRRTAKCAT